MMDIRKRFPGIQITEMEAKQIMEAERNAGFECPNEVGLETLLLFLRLSTADQLRAIEWMKAEGWGNSENQNILQ